MPDPETGPRESLWPALRVVGAMTRGLLAFGLLALLALVPAAQANSYVPPPEGPNAWVYFGHAGECVVGYSLSGGVCDGWGHGAPDHVVSVGAQVAGVTVCVGEGAVQQGAQCNHQ